MLSRIYSEIEHKTKRYSEQNSPTMHTIGQGPVGYSTMILDLGVLWWGPEGQSESTCSQ